MKNFLVYIVLTCTPLAALAQADSVKASRWSIGGAVTQLHSFYRWKAPLAEGSSYEFDSGFNLRAGVETHFVLNEKLSLTGGLAYAKRDYSLMYQCSNCGILDLSPNTVKLRYLDVPFSLNYKLKSGKLNIDATAGIAASYLLQSWTTYNYGDDGKSITYITDNAYRKVLATANVGLRTNYRLSKEWSLGAALAYSSPLYEPSFDYEMTWTTLQSTLSFTYHL